MIEPEPRFLYSGARRHIARPDHPMGVIPTTIAFCGSTARTAEPGRELAACKRCSVAWLVYLDRLAQEPERTEEVR